MKAIYKGKCHYVVSRDADTIWIKQLFRGTDRSDSVPVRLHDPDLILDPTDEDLDLAEAFERGESMRSSTRTDIPSPQVSKSKAFGGVDTFVDSPATETSRVDAPGAPSRTVVMRPSAHIASTLNQVGGSRNR